VSVSKNVTITAFLGSISFFAIAAVASCGGNGDASPAADAAPATDAAEVSDVTADGPFVSAAHTAFPTVPKGSGPVLANPQIVTVTFADHPDVTQLSAFGDWIATSSWLSAVGKDYGVGLGTHAHVTLPTPAKTAFTDADVQQAIADGISSGALPSADAGTSPFLYVMFFSPGMSIATPAILGGFDICQLGAAGGYHWEGTTPKVSYAVVPSCADETLEQIEQTASHEIIEAATDPLDSTATAWAISDANNPWAGGGGEVADLCEGQNVSENGFSVTRVWSNAAAAQNKADPCIPAPTAPFFDTAIATSKAEPVAPGKSITLNVVGFSSAPMPAWGIQVVTVPALSAFDPKPSLSASVMENGGTATLTMQVPANAASQTFATVLLYSTSDGVDPKFWPAVVYAP
jgi:hypothetical protein